MPSGWSPKPPVPAVGGLFFPQSKSLGLDRTDYSPSLQDKLVFAGVSSHSFPAASTTLDKLSDLDVNAKVIERLVKRIGLERVAERSAAAAAYQSLPLPQRKDAPTGVTPPAVAVVGTDGGRLQIRPDSARPDDETPPAEDGGVAAAASDRSQQRSRCWREDKIGLLMGMSSDVAASDPCPDLPDSFLDPTRMGKLVRQLNKKVALGEEAAAAAADPNAEQQALADNEYHWQPPKVEEKRLVATRRNWATFGLLVAAAAWRMGLFAAQRCAFLGDGSDNNWTVWRKYFSSFVPILDFIHALSYVYAAAHAGRGRAEGWRCYARWIRWLWAGQVEAVLLELKQRQQEIGQPEEGEKVTSPRQVVARALVYLENNKTRMRYDEYRRQGLPIVSSYVESAVKQFNQRVKGTEKFWTEEGAEAILQLRADQLSDDQPLDEFWQRRQETATGQRPYRSVA
jgi:hypothetical protein